LEKKLEINVDAWKVLNAENKLKKKEHSSFLLFDTESQIKPQQPSFFLFGNENNMEKPDSKQEITTKQDKIKDIVYKESQETLLAKKKEKTLSIFILILVEIKEKEIRKEQNKLKKEKRKKKLEGMFVAKKEYKQKEKNIEEKLEQRFSEAFGEDKTKEYLRMVKMIKEKSFNKKRNKMT
jgi:hypothetical protein